MAAATAPCWKLFLNRENQVWDETWRVLAERKVGAQSPTALGTFNAARGVGCRTGP